jgi:hypothetical protein
MVALAGRQLAKPLRDTAIILLLCDTGIRRSEVCRLRLAGVIEGDHMASSVTVRGTGDKYRRIEIHPQTQRAVFEYLVNERPQRVRSEALFLDRGAHDELVSDGRLLAGVDGRRTDDRIGRSTALPHRDLRLAQQSDGSAADVDELEGGNPHFIERHAAQIHARRLRLHPARLAGRATARPEEDRCHANEQQRGNAEPDVAEDAVLGARRCLAHGDLRNRIAQVGRSPVQRPASRGPDLLATPSGVVGRPPAGVGRHA